MGIDLIVPLFIPACNKITCILLPTYNWYFKHNLRAVWQEDDLALFALKLGQSGQNMWVCGFHGSIFLKLPLRIDRQGEETLKKDPLWSNFLDKRSGNDLARYNAKAGRRFLSSERCPPLTKNAGPVTYPDFFKKLRTFQRSCGLRNGRQHKSSFSTVSSPREPTTLRNFV
ncbi:hypothetical protein NE619_15840 [Anaerovorax odorimutans]|uniref:Uncharacterized protein n=1 Tax=Anaerovorax odorimutans TaxID=109327 RepID=A0ABT1RSQ0_9FIRM|nr:hypothetical protein [Anaerovorax odorimutans]